LDAQKLCTNKKQLLDIDAGKLPDFYGQENGFCSFRLPEN